MRLTYLLTYTISLWLLCNIVLISCNKKQEHADISKIILSLKESGELITAEYTLSKVIRASDDKTWYKIGDRKILINCEAYLKAGINLQTISEKDFYIQNDSIAVILPHAQLFSLHIPPDKIKISYQDIGIFRDPFSAAEREQLLAQAELQIKSLVASLGILQTAENNGAVFIQHLLQQTGFKKVSVTYR